MWDANEKDKRLIFLLGENKGGIFRQIETNVEDRKRKRDCMEMGKFPTLFDYQHSLVKVYINTITDKEREKIHRSYTRCDLKM